MHLTIDFLMGVQIISSMQPCGEDGALQPRLAFVGVEKLIGLKPPETKPS